MTLTVIARASLPAVVACALIGCQAQKSANPLSPSVAGPIAGVQISAPKLVEPVQGVKYKESQQPIKLVVENATTNGQRPITYSFEVATDATFATKVFARAGVPPGEGLTSVQIDRLELGRTYLWRSRAEDGANTGNYSTSQFDLLPKAQLSAPVAVSPVNNDRAASRRPTLIVNNAIRNDAVGALNYDFQVATDQAFTQMVASGIVGEGGGQTSFTSANDLAADKQHFWRVRASDGETTSAWAGTQAFLTPTAVIIPPGGGGGGGGNCDALVGNKPALVQCIHATVKPTDEYGAFEVAKRVAWALRGEGGGLLIKNGGENIVQWQGYWFSASRICYPDGHIYKVISDAGPGGANGPTWSDNDFVDRSLYVPAIDPSRR